VCTFENKDHTSNSFETVQKVCTSTHPFPRNGKFLHDTKFCPQSCSFIIRERMWRSWQESYFIRQRDAVFYVLKSNFPCNILGQGLLNVFQRRVLVNLLSDFTLYMPRSRDSFGWWAKSPAWASFTDQAVVETQDHWTVRVITCPICT
jgi:hypothetical protein